VKVLLITDQFMRPELYRRTLNAALGAFGPFEYDVLDTLWPTEPFTSNAEIREFCGPTETVAVRVREAGLCVTNHGPLPDRVLAQGKRLRAVGVCRGGPTNVNIAAATARGIPVLYSPGRNAQAVAEWTVGLVIVGPRRLTMGHDALRTGVWRGDLYRADLAGEELAGLTVGIVGCGHIGRLVAALLRTLGSRVIACDPYVTADAITAAGAEPRSLDTLLSEADIVTLHARLTPETHHLIDAAALARMKPTAYLINTARGELVDEAALAAALRAGRLAGAALDTFDPEPPSSENPLLRMNTVTVSPHIAGATHQTARRAIETVAADIGRLLRGETPRFCANPETLRAQGT
jgi:D-3-phosphoglycerate dehydrogenase / 2-oxoglutarate reductase